MGTQQEDFADFYRRSKDECLFTVLVSVANRDTAQELVAEAFARAWASWRTVSRHPAPKAWVVRTALNVNISWWRRRRREVSVAEPGWVADLPTAEGVAGSPVDPRIMAALLRLSVRQRQAALHADGVPSYIAFAGPAPAYCTVVPVSQAQLQAIYQLHPGSRGVVLVIDPSKIPSGDGLFIFDIPVNPAGVKPPSPSSRAGPSISTWSRGASTAR